MFNILIIDPDPRSCALIEAFISNAHLSEPIDIESSSDLESAIERYRSRPFELIIVDPKIADGAGLALLKTIYECCPTQKIIALSTCSTDPCPPECRLQCIEYGANIALDKVSAFSKLPCVVREVGRLNNTAFSKSNQSI